MKILKTNTVIWNYNGPLRSFSKQAGITVYDAWAFSKNS